VTAAETPVIAATVGSLLGKTAAAWRAPEFGLSDADRLVVTFRDGSAAFVKRATTEETAGWLRNEHRILDHLRGTSLSPEVLGWQDDGTGQPLLVTEDLSAAYWPAAGAENPDGGTSTVWRPGDIDVLRRTLDRLRRTPLSSSVLTWCMATSAATTCASSATSASAKFASSTGRTPAPATSCTTSCSCSPRFTWRAVRRRGRCAPDPCPSSRGLQGRRSSAPA
jgi:hypothetical protein